jgi:cytochrome c553
LDGTRFSEERRGADRVASEPKPIDEGEAHMRPRVATFLAAALAAAAAGSASAQQPASPAPTFANPNLTEKGVRALAANCAICHGTEGRAAAGSTVRGLAGRPRQELVQIMAAFRDGSRPATIMHQVVKGFSEAEIDAMADWFSRKPR